MYARPPSHAEALGPGSAGPSLALPYANPLDQVSANHEGTRSARIRVQRCPQHGMNKASAGFVHRISIFPNLASNTLMPDAEALA